MSSEDWWEWLENQVICYHGDLPEEVANDAGYTYGDNAGRINGLEFCRRVLELWGIITPKESEKALARVEKLMAKMPKLRMDDEEGVDEMGDGN